MVSGNEKTGFPVNSPHPIASDCARTPKAGNDNGAGLGVLGVGDPPVNHPSEPLRASPGIPEPEADGLSEKTGFRLGGRNDNGVGLGAYSDSASQFRAMSSREPQVTRDPVFKALDAHTAMLERIGEPGEKTGFRFGGRNDNGLGSGAYSVQPPSFALCHPGNRRLPGIQSLRPWTYTRLCWRG